MRNPANLGTRIHYADDPAEPGFDEDPNVRHPLTGAKPDYWFTIQGGKRVPRWRPPVLKRGDDPKLWWYSIKEIAERCGMCHATTLARVKKLRDALGDALACPGGRKLFVRGDAIPLIMRQGREAFLK